MCKSIAMFVSEQYSDNETVFVVASYFYHRYICFALSNPENFVEQFRHRRKPLSLPFIDIISIASFVVRRTVLGQLFDDDMTEHMQGYNEFIQQYHSLLIEFVQEMLNQDAVNYPPFPEIPEKLEEGAFGAIAAVCSRQ